MTYSRKQLEALGEPFGECATRLKLGGRIYGGGGSPSTPSEMSQRTVGYSKEYEPIVREAVDRAVYEASKPYEAYKGKRLAGFDPLQLQAQQAVANLKPAQQLGTATQFAGLAGLKAGDIRYDPTRFAAERATTQQFTDPSIAAQYMSPYMQNVVDIQKREAQRQGDIARTQRGAQAVGAGAFGGSRQAIMEAEAQRNLSQQMGDIQAKGSQAAYEQAAQQFQTDQARGLQAALANQQAMLEAQRLGEQSRQYGAGLGLQGLQTQLQAAGQLGQLGQTQFGQEQAIIDAQARAGAQRQALEQQRMSQGYEDFLAQKQHPYQQIAFMQEMLKGTPQQTTQSIYAAPPSLASQLGGAASIYAGGKMAGYFANGGLTTLALHNMMK
jgi:hypothetical protein